MPLYPYPLLIFNLVSFDPKAGFSNLPDSLVTPSIPLEPKVRGDRLWIASGERKKYPYPEGVKAKDQVIKIWG